MNTIMNKNTKSFKEFKKNIFDIIICLIGESLTSYILEKWDDEINKNRDKKKETSGQSISAGGVWNLIQKIGQKIGERPCFLRRWMEYG